MVLQTEFAQIKGNDLYIDDVKATDLVKQYGSPLYVMSEGHIRKQFNTLKTKMIDKYENTLPLFASKSFSCKAIYKLAMEYGVGIDCVSAGEISVALKAGFDPKKIYFHGNNKLPSEIQYALENGVENFVIDNFYEIELVEEIASKLNVMVNGLVRITPGVYAGGHDYIRVGAKDTKFGFSSHDNTYLKAIKKVIDAPHINFDGIHCHVGSQIEEIQAYGMTDNIRSSLYNAKYDAVIANKAGEEADHLVTVAGKNCESGDILIKDIMLQDPQPGDILAMFSTGAYHYSMSSNYNQLPKPAVVFTYQGHSKEVIRRQTFDDLVAYDVD